MTIQLPDLTTRNVEKALHICYSGFIYFKESERSDIMQVLQTLQIKGYEKWTKGEDILSGEPTRKDLKWTRRRLRILMPDSDSDDNQAEERTVNVTSAEDQKRTTEEAHTSAKNAEESGRDKEIDQTPGVSRKSLDIIRLSALFNIFFSHGRHPPLRPLLRPRCSRLPTPAFLQWGSDSGKFHPDL